MLIIAKLLMYSKNVIISRKVCVSGYSLSVLVYRSQECYLKCS